MIESLITSKTRLKLLFKFFLNTNNNGYLRSLEKEFNENSNSIRLELNRLEDAGMLSTSKIGNRKVYRANKSHPILTDLQSILMKFAGIDQLIERVIDRLGNVNLVYLDGDIAKGVKSDLIDVILIGDGINTSYLVHLISRAEPILKKKIRFLVLTVVEAKSHLENRKQNLFLIWELNISNT